MPALAIYTPKKRLVFMLFASVVFVTIGIWILTLPAGKIGFKGTLAAYIGIPFFGFGGLFLFLRLLSPKPAVVIDDSGFLDNASAVSAGLIPWADISGVRVSSFRNQRFLAIYVDDPGKYISQANLLKRAIMCANQSMVGTAITIPLSVLSISSDDLLSVIGKYLRTGVVNG